MRGRRAQVQEGTRGAEGQIRVGNWALLQMDRNDGESAPAGASLSAGACV